MRGSFWFPRRPERREESRPYLEVPPPWADLPWEPPETELDERDRDGSQRVIIIEI